MEKYQRVRSGERGKEREREARASGEWPQTRKSICTLEKWEITGCCSVLNRSSANTFPGSPLGVPIFPLPFWRFTACCKSTFTFSLLNCRTVAVTRVANTIVLVWRKYGTHARSIVPRVKLTPTYSEGGLCTVDIEQLCARVYGELSKTLAHSSLAPYFLWWDAAFSFFHSWPAATARLVHWTHQADYATRLHPAPSHCSLIHWLYSQMYSLVRPLPTPFLSPSLVPVHLRVRHTEHNTLKWASAHTHSEVKPTWTRKKMLEKLSRHRQWGREDAHIGNGWYLRTNWEIISEKRQIREG